MDVYEPAEDSHLLNKWIKLAENRVLDMGTGSGIQALSLIKSPYVREVIAADINEQAIKILQEHLQKHKLRKIRAVHSDLFQNISGQFNYIIFNPPYLSQDKGIQDDALYGGKKGWEISERFFQEASKHLFPDGKILFLFSSLTNKRKIDEIITHRLFQYQELDKEKLHFEELYVYEITKTPLLRELESKGLNNIHYFTHGKRGIIYKAFMDKNKHIKSHLPKKDIVLAAIKAEKEGSKAVGTIKNETKWLQILNKYHIGPYFFFAGENYLVCQFIEGKFLEVWTETRTSSEIIKVLKDILHQCYILDTLKLTKEEMHHPSKHIIIDSNNDAILLDFERCAETLKPKNVTQFLEYLCRLKKTLFKRNVLIDTIHLRTIAKEYKQKYAWKVLEGVFAGK